MNDWSEKIWGKTRCIIDTDYYSEHELNVIAGGFCSCHYHRNRANQIKVISGCIRIIWLFGWKVRSTLLTSGETCTVSSYVPHQFQMIRDGVVIEKYFPDRNGKVLNSDIIRLTRGGKTDPEFIKETVGVLDEDGTWIELIKE